MGSIHKLIIEDDEGKTTVVPVSRGEITIGRMEGNTIRLMERNVSRRHARLLRDNGAVFIEDLSSFNGVKINGERIDAKLEIKEGDLVEIGDYHLALQAVEVEDDAAARGESVTQMGKPPAEGPTQLAPAMAPPGAHVANGNAWRAMATVPDFQAEDAMREARSAIDARATEINTTANMRPAPIGPPDPMVGPPPARDQRQGPSLPPFPAGNLTAGLADVPFSGAGAGLAALRGRDDAALRTEQIQVGPARVADVPRLVCVSTEYAGKDFPITRAEVVIGRVEDNDVVIEHRSVSRNHAKVMFDGRVHKIIDLQSANGILVNGEEYAITDLRKNDLIELGHVKFRFIPAGEPFAPTEEEAKAMREAGVTPPPATGAPATPARTLDPPPMPARSHDTKPPPNGRADGVPADTVEMPVHVDPSSAATITDTPVNIFGNEAPQPRLEPPTERPVAPRAKEPERRDARKNDTVPDAGPGLRTGGTASASRPRPEVEVKSSAPKTSRIAVALVVVALLLSGLVVAVTKLGGGGAAAANDQHDQQIRALITQGRVDEARAYLKEHVKELADPAAAIEAIDAAANAKAPEPAPSEAPVPTVSAAPSPSATPEVVPEGDEPAPPEGDEPAPAPGAPRKKKPGPPPADLAKRTEEAKQYLRDANSVMLFKPNAWGEAEALLKQCLAKAELAECHYQLGVVYAKLDETARSLQHYRRFVELEPRSEKAKNVRGFLKNFE